VLLYYRWATMTEPTCVLIVVTPEPLKGGQITVDSVTLPSPYKVTIGDSDRYTFPFYLEPGRYMVRVEQNGQMLWKADVELTGQALIVRTYTRVNETMLAQAPRLKVIGRGGVGLKNIDVPACQRRGIEIVFTPDTNTLTIGDFVIGGILQLLHPWTPFKQEVHT